MCMIAKVEQMRRRKDRGPGTGILDESMAGDSPVVIKRIKKGGHGGHHGGAWKVAYADFVTAMMAFFLLMWLINTTTPEQKRGIADYFAPQSIAQTVSGSGGVLGGKVMGQDSARAGGALGLPEEQPALADGTAKKALASGATRAAPTSDRPASQMPTVESVARTASSRTPPKRSTRPCRTIPISPTFRSRSSPSKRPRACASSSSTRTAARCSSRAPPSRCPIPRTCSPTVGKIIDRLPNRVSISGHTDGNAVHRRTADELGVVRSARQRQARALLQAGGLNPATASTKSRAKRVPSRCCPKTRMPRANRRLSILLMREAPPAPPSRPALTFFGQISLSAANFWLSAPTRAILELRVGTP